MGDRSAVEARGERRPAGGSSDHCELVARAERWLRNTRGCGVVLTEFQAAVGEQPDAIGWREGGRWSILVECKASRADFRADQLKPSRRRAALAHYRIGKERWYMTPPGMLWMEEVPEGWGLLEVSRTVRVVARPPEALGSGQQWPGDLCEYAQITVREMPFIYSALRRHHCRTCFREINHRPLPRREGLSG